MKDLHQSFRDILLWPYPEFMMVIDQYTDLMKERAKAEDERSKDHEAEMHSKMSSMQRQYTPPGLSKLANMSNFPSMSNLPNFSNFKL